MEDRLISEKELRKLINALVIADNVICTAYNLSKAIGSATGAYLPPYNGEDFAKHLLAALNNPSSNLYVKESEI